jgi:hypothetical protein
MHNTAISVCPLTPTGLSLVELRTWFTKDAFNGSKSWTCPALRYITRTSPSFVELISSHGIRAAGAEPWIYLKAGDGVPCNNTAAEGHCFPVAGTPKPDADGDWAWWTVLFSGAFRVLRELDPTLQYVHIWNEPNAHFFRDQMNGTWFAEFYIPGIVLLNLNLH